MFNRCRRRWAAAAPAKHEWCIQKTSHILQRMKKNSILAHANFDQGMAFNDTVIQ